MISGNHRATISCVQDFFEQTINALWLIRSDRVKRDNCSPNKPVVCAVRQLSKFPIVTSKERGLSLANFVKDLAAMALSVLIFVRKALNNLLERQFIACALTF